VETPVTASNVIGQAAATETPTPHRAPTPFWLYILGGFSILLGVITGIPQLYYVLFALNPHIFAIGPNTNPLGDVWYSYILVGDNSYQKVDPGILAGAVEDAFMMGPLYFVTGIGLLRRSPWVFVVGLITSAMIFYAIIGFFLGDIFAGLNTVTNQVSYWASNLPYLIYPLVVFWVLIFRRSLFTRQPVS